MPSKNDPLGLRNSLRMTKPKATISMSSRRKKKADREPDPSFLQSLGHAGLGLAGAAGNTLDVPGSMVRDTLAGQNPFDQLLSPFSDKNRTSGRDLARQYGMAGKEDTWGNFFGGLATEFATDPLTITGLKPLGNTLKGLSLAKAGGKAATTLAGGIAKGERALATGKIPFGPHWAIGKGQGAQKAAQHLDKAWETARWSKPGRVAAGLFSAAADSRVTKRGQELAAKVFEANKRSRVKEKSSQIHAAVKLQRAGITDNDVFAHMLEKPDLNHPLSSLVNEIHASKNKLYRKRAAMGQVSGARLEDKYIQHAHRYSAKSNGVLDQFSSTPKNALTSSKDRPRQWIFKNFKEGRKGINELLKDPRWEKMLQESAAAKMPYGDVHKKVSEELGKMNAGDALFDSKHSSITIQRAPKSRTRGVANLAKMKAVVAKKFGKDVAEQIKWDDLADKTAGNPDVKFMIKRKVQDRTKRLADYIMTRPDGKMEKGLYQNNPLIDAHNANLNARNKIAIQHHLNEDLFRNTLPESVTAQKGTWASTGEKIKLPKRADRAYEIAKPGQVTVGGLFRNLGVDPRKAVSRLLVNKGIEPNADNLFASLKSTIPEDVAKDFMAVYSKSSKSPVEGEIAKLFRSYGSIWKAAALAHPATKVRDRFSGEIQNRLHGLAKGIPFLNSTSKNATDVYLGKAIGGLQEVPAIKKWVAEQGLPMNDQNATDALRHLYASNIPGSVSKTSDVAGSHVISDSPTLSSILGHVPGYEPSTIWGNIKKTARTAAGLEPDSTWNPFKTTVRGAGDANETNQALFKAADMASNYTDVTNRLGPFSELLKDGYDPFAAMQRVNDVQVDYSPSTFTDFEKKMKLAMPFYGFTSKSLRHVTKELASNPGGGLAAMVRAQNNARDRSGMVPEHLEDTASIRLPVQNDDGSMRFLSSLGMMHEDPLQFLQPDLQKVGAEALSRTAPYIQQPLQYITGQSLFQPGRPLDEMTPNTGQLFANLTGMEGEDARYPGDTLVEAAVNMSPFTRMATTARQLTDPRKEWWNKLLNTTTGMKVVDVSPQTQERSLRRKVEKAAKAMGGKTSTSVYFPEKLNGNEEINKYKDLLKHLAKKSKARSKAKKKAAKK